VASDALKERMKKILAALKAQHPDARCGLNFQNPYQLLIATILAAQSTDTLVNKVAPGLFTRYPNAEALAEAGIDEIRQAIKPIGLWQRKSKSLFEVAKELVARHKGEVPKTIEELTDFYGIGRKTANVVLGAAFGVPSIAVDTHVLRLVKRLDLTRKTDPVKVEFALQKIVPEEDWTKFGHLLQFHGRRICLAQRPKCDICPVLDLCPAGQRLMAKPKKPKRATRKSTKAARAAGSLHLF
jgi:endonuclease-3